MAKRRGVNIGNVSASLSGAHIAELNKLSPGLGSKLQASLSSLANAHQALSGTKGPVELEKQQGKSAKGVRDPALILNRDRITGVADPVSPDDVVNKAYVDRLFACENLLKAITPCWPGSMRNQKGAQQACQSPALKELSLTGTPQIFGPSVVIGGAFAYIVGTTPVGNFHTIQVWNIDNTSGPSQFSSFTTAVSTAIPGVKCVRQGRYLYAMNLADAFTGNIIVWDIYDPEHPFDYTHISVGTAYDLTANGRYLYLASDNIVRLDVSAPADVVNPGPNYTLVVPTNPSAYRGVLAQDGFLFAANVGIFGNGSLDAFKIYDPTSPSQVGSITLGSGGSANGPQSLATEAGFAFVVDILGNLYVVDTHDPTAMVLVSTTPLPSVGAARNRICKIDGDNLIVTGAADSTFLYDITTRTAPKLLATDPLGVNSIALEGRNMIGVKG